MGIDVIIKIAGIGLLTAVVGQVLKQSGKEEIATFSTLAGIIVVLFMVLNMVSDLFSTISSMFSLY